MQKKLWELILDGDVDYKFNELGYIIFNLPQPIWDFAAYGYYMLLMSVS